MIHSKHDEPNLDCRQYTCIEILLCTYRMLDNIYNNSTLVYYLYDGKPYFGGNYLCEVRHYNLESLTNSGGIWHINIRDKNTYVYKNNSFTHIYLQSKL